MLILISPAKTLDFDSPAPTSVFSQPDMLDHSEQLIDVLSTKSPDEIEKMMKISAKLAQLNVDRYHTWTRHFDKDNAKQALFAFQGDVYTGLAADQLNEADLDYAQNNLRILSGLYGVLRPLDLMQPYRLEMGTKLANDRGQNLYQFWGDLITDSINEHLTKTNKNLVLNLASNEYFKSVKIESLKADIVTPVFKDWKNDQYKMISFFAKKARGLMSAWVIKNRVEDLDQLTSFNVDGYQFSPNDSDALNPVFVRKQG